MKVTPWASERVLVLTDWTHWSWESQQSVNGHTKSHDICRCIVLGRCHQSSKQQQRNHRRQHSYQVVTMGTSTSLAELLLCHCMLGLCGFLTVIHQLNLAFETVQWAIRIAGIMNRRTAWTVLLPCPTILPKQVKLLCCLLSQQRFMGQLSSCWWCLLFLIQSNPQDTCSKFVTRPYFVSGAFMLLWWWPGTTSAAHLSWSTP